MAEVAAKKKVYKVDAATASYRPCKPLRKAYHRNSNLVVYGFFRNVGDNPDKRAAVLAPVQLHGLSQSVTNSSDTHATTSTQFRHSCLPKSSRMDTSLRSRKSVPRLTVSRTQIAAGVAVALVIGAVTFSTLTSRTLAQPQDFDLVVQLLPSVVEPSSSHKAASEQALSNLRLRGVEIAALQEKLEHALKVTARHKEQGIRYRSDNASLQVKVDSLEAETLALNQELLDLDLAMAALNSKAEAAVEKRTVYNFVNVPIGTDKMPDLYADTNVQHSDEAYTGELYNELETEPYEVAYNEQDENSDNDPSYDSIDQEYPDESIDPIVTKDNVLELRMKKIQQMRKDFENDITGGVRTISAKHVYNHQDFWAESTDADL